MIMCVLLCYPVSIRTYYQQGVLFLVWGSFCVINENLIQFKYTLIQVHRVIMLYTENVK